ncbi:NAD(P)-binding protein [Lindgomyces ingoldianus]|uniref:NAD(P)-binding protein n=1 Tax=Lindgomyces ingoldianus TaxID=673940 RepID=A0ACB6QEG6_9PLEO|nr:NAD(P)-binding protein [Lindgomyces ingoldianus]KAF2465309.1 NAD(P)-binding protein [Lindgomyces ingoldianus]
MALDLPNHYAKHFTPTIHCSIPSNIDPTKVSLSKPFVAVVTGAGKGLGYHISLAYAKAGCTGISISSRTQSDLDALSKELKSINPNLEILSSICDTQSEASILDLETAVREKWGRVDAIIANAGIISKYIQKPGESEHHLPIGLEDDNDWARVLDININGTWRIAKAFMSLLKATTDGPQTLIVNTSLAAHSTNSQLCPIAYNVSKLACNRFVEHVDNDHREKDGIHAYALHPGAVLTPQTAGHTGEVWGPLLTDDPGLAGAMCVWLSREKRGWLSGRYVTCNWDVKELEGMKERIEQGDLLKFRMAV